MHTSVCLDSDNRATPRSHSRPDHAADHHSDRSMRPSSPAQARGDAAGAHQGSPIIAENGAASISSWRAVTRPRTYSVTQAVYEAWQGRENCIARAAMNQIPSHRIARMGLDSPAQVRRLLGIRVVAKWARGLKRLRDAAVAFGDAQLFPQDRVRVPAIRRAWQMCRARKSNLFVLRFA